MVKKNLIHGIFGILFILSILSIAYLSLQNADSPETLQPFSQFTQGVTERSLDIQYETVIKVLFRMARSLMSLS